MQIGLTVYPSKQLGMERDRVTFEFVIQVWIRMFKKKYNTTHNTQNQIIQKKQSNKTLNQ